MKLTHALAVALVLAAPAAAQNPTTVVPVHFYSFGFIPSPISLRAGEQVTMVFTNDAGVSHEFKAEAFFHSAKIVSGAIDEEGSIELKPHTSASITLIPARGTYPVHCGHFMHAQMGMRTTIFVQ